MRLSSANPFLLSFAVRCTELPDTGTCRHSLSKWYYIPASQDCNLFNYGGCEGNDNRFETREACMKMCRGVTGWLLSRLTILCVFAYLLCAWNTHGTKWHNIYTSFFSHRQGKHYIFTEFFTIFIFLSAQCFCSGLIFCCLSGAGPFFCFKLCSLVVFEPTFSCRASRELKL